MPGLKIYASVHLLVMKIMKISQPANALHKVTSSISSFKLINCVQCSLVWINRGEKTFINMFIIDLHITFSRKLAINGNLTWFLKYSNSAVFSLVLNFPVKLQGKDRQHTCNMRKDLIIHDCASSNLYIYIQYFTITKRILSVQSLTWTSSWKMLIFQWVTFQ